MNEKFAMIVATKTNQYVSKYVVGCDGANSITRKSIGIDIDKDYCALAKKRLINEANILTRKLDKIEVMN